MSKGRIAAFAVALSHNLFFESEDEDNNNTILPKVLNFAEVTVQNFQDNQFKQNFRMSPESFEDLLIKLHHPKPDEPGHPEISLEKQLMITVWYLGNMESFRSIAGRFGISKSTAWDILERTSKKVLHSNQQYGIIRWPSPQRALYIINQFSAVNGFPGVIGCIDGSHIRILPPKEHPNSYANRKSFHSVILQGVCDHQKLFLDVYVGEPGSMHDSRVFQKSDLKARIDNNDIEFPYDSHLIGDLAYGISKTLIVGFKDHGNLTRRQTLFNQRLSQIRIAIENTFAILKGRFRRLKYMETRKMHLICLFIVTACILHNICILNGDTPENLMDPLDVILQEEIVVADEEVENVARNRREGVLKRNNILRNVDVP